MMIPFEKAKEILHSQIQPMVAAKTKEDTPLWDAGGRVLAKEIVAREDVPSFHRSPIDGFAIQAADTQKATAEHPIKLKIIDTIAAGSRTEKVLAPGTTMKIFTGAPLPEEADSLIKKEEVTETTSPTGDGAIIIQRSLTQGECVVIKGEDISCGERIFSPGSLLTSAHMGILATLGVDPVCVYKRPKVGIFSTGNELVDLRSPLEYGQLRASNIYTLAEIIREAGGEPINLGVVRDRVEDILNVYEKAQELHLPLVLSTGGTASGEYDVIKEAMDRASSTRLFNKVAIRPGAPVVASIKEGQLLIGLSGNPAGATAATLLLFFPIISKLAGLNQQLICSQGQLTQPLSRKKGLMGFMWGSFYEERGQIYAFSFENQFCGALKTHAKSNCLIEVPAGRVEYRAGDLVTLWKLP